MDKPRARNRLSLKKLPNKTSEKDQARNLKHMNKNVKESISLSSPPKKRQKINLLPNTSHQTDGFIKGKRQLFTTTEKNDNSSTVLGTLNNFCPSCQIPLSVFSALFVSWHIAECLEVQRNNMSECSAGIHCNSTVESHYRNFTHYKLAAHRVGAQAPDVILESCESNSQLNQSTEDCDVINLSDINVKYPKSVSDLEGSQNKGNMKNVFDVSLTTSPKSNLKNIQSCRNFEYLNSSVSEDSVINLKCSLPDDSKKVRTCEATNNISRVACDVSEKHLNIHETKFIEESILKREGYSQGTSLHFSSKQSLNCKTSGVGSHIKNVEDTAATILQSTHSNPETSDISVQNKINKLSPSDMPSTLPVANSTSVPSSPRMKRQASIKSFFKSPGKNENDSAKIIFVEESPLKGGHNRSKGKLREEHKSPSSVSDKMLQQKGSSGNLDLTKVNLSQTSKDSKNYRPEPESQKIKTNSRFYRPFPKSQGATNQDGSRKRCPFYKKIQGTSFAVDAFSYGSIPGITHYFLSHFHSDHYTGLTKNFQHIVYCSSVTANLVSLKLRLPAKYLHRLPLNKPCILDGVKVILFDANHCPGSVMFLFGLPNGRCILHTGDFRASLEMQKLPFLKYAIDQLYLDTTYLDPFYNFPSQKAVLEYVTSLAVRRVQENPKTLIVCGSYTIGKEKVFLAIAEALNCSVWAKRDKQNILKCLENERICSRLVNKELQAQVHVLAMNQITLKFLYNYLSQLSEKFDEILGLKPTGWTHSSHLIADDSLNLIKPSGKKPVTIYGVPYSEHSSFSELQSFVQFVRPRQIIPTVNNGSEKSRAAMSAIFKQWLKI